MEIYPNKIIAPLIVAKELAACYKDENLILIDARNHKDAKLQYETAHLDSALFVDVNTDLAAIKENIADGGRHPLPTIAVFSKTLARLGITKDSHVVVYDDKNGANAAARFWWMLKAVGHEKIQVLDGGMFQAVASGIPMNSNTVIARKCTENYAVKDWEFPLAAIDEVASYSEKTGGIIIDVRESIRYHGINEPIDGIAGHIPTAINMPFSTNLDAAGNFLKPEELRQKYEALMAKKSAGNIIVHCGSGVTACHTILAFYHAGLPVPKLYIGSWSEWSRNNKKIAKSC